MRTSLALLIVFTFCCLANGQATSRDWTYLVRPKEATVETAFQGLLVTRSGEYVWQTKDREAYSQTNYRMSW
ncbi:MAG TPA: hypothetical protein VK208_07480 [Pyrinomonadaceae bacterium]|jgi:hypothetical protein|nr:hypothetical protein [Pyrinomonadaceae bacterium]